MSPKNAKYAAVFELVSHLRLTSPELANAATFMRDRERYEIEIEESENASARATYCLSVDPIFIRSAHTMEVFDKIAPS